MGSFRIWSLVSEGNIEGISRILKSGDFEERQTAVEALGKMRDERAIEPLTHALKYDENFDIRTAAGEALLKIKRAKPIEVLGDALQHKDERVRASAAKALGKTKSERALETLIKASKDKDFSVRSEAIEALGKIKGERALETLIKASKDKDYHVRSKAIEALCKKKTIPIAQEALIEALNDRDFSLQKASANALGDLGGERGAKILIEALRGDWTGVEREKSTLVKIGKQTVEPLLEGLKDKDKILRWRLIEILDEIGDEKAAQPLIEAWKNESIDYECRFCMENRFLISKALKKKKFSCESLSETQKPWYYAITEDWDKCLEFGEQAVTPLIKKLGEFNHIEVRWISPLDRRDTIDTLVKIGKPAVQPLIEALKNKNKQVRIQAAEALEDIEDEKSVKPLTKAMKDKEEKVREAAQRALDKIRAKKS